jgi:hypothetical protein
MSYDTYQIRDGDLESTLLKLCELVGVEQYPPYSDALHNCIAYLPDLIALRHRLPRNAYRFSDTLELFLDCCDEHPVDINAPIQNAYVHEFIDDLRHRLMNPKYRYRMTDVRREAERNFQSLQMYVDDLFVRWSRIVVIRIDLSYRQELDVTYERLKTDLATFYNNRRHNALFDYECGFIMKIEYGLEKQLHVHACFFFDGHKRRGDADVYLAQSIGDYWQNTITHGDGIYWNCNANKRDYRYNGIGLVEHFDHDKRNNLNRAMEYLCKKRTQVIKPLSSLRAKMLSKGDLRNHNPNLGRRRLS